MQKRLLAIAVCVALLPTALSVAQSDKDESGENKIMINPDFAKMGTAFYVYDFKNSITFKSEAPLEDIVGTTNEITGYLIFDPANPTKGGRGELTVPVASLNTGIPMRNEHVQSPGWLNAEEFPDIKMTISDVKNVTEKSSTEMAKTYDVTVVGDLSMHGKSKVVEFPATVSYMKESEQTGARLPGDLLAARGDLTISLADFGVTGPEGSGLVGTKVDQDIEIEIRVFASTEMRKPRKK